MSHMRTRLSVVATVVLSVVALAGCGNSAVPGTPLPGSSLGTVVTEQKKPDEPAKADPKSLISNAAKTTRDAATCKFEQKIQLQGAGDPAVGAWTSTGELDFKNGRSKVDSVMDMGGQKMRMSILVDGQAMYMRTFADGAPTPKWTKTDLKQLEESLGQLGGGTANGGSNGAGDPMMFIDKIKEIATVTPDGSETIRGVPTTRYNVAVDPAKIPASEKDQSDVPADAASAMKLFVDSQGRLARFQMSMTGDGNGGSMSWDFFDYGALVKIDPPAPGEIAGN
jgi:hypothetical protein